MRDVAGVAHGVTMEREGAIQETVGRESHQDLEMRRLYGELRKKRQIKQDFHASELATECKSVNSAGLLLKPFLSSALTPGQLPGWCLQH